MVPGATRYRDQQNEIHLTSGADGKFEVNWPQAGMYWLETASEDAKTTLPDAKQRRLSYVAVFEVLSQ